MSGFVLHTFCAPSVSLFTNCVFLSLSVWAALRARGLIILLMSHSFTGLQCVRVFACVTERARMVCPSPINGDNKRQPWALREISIIREKHRELGWLRGTRLAKLSEEFGVSGELETEWVTSHLWETDELGSYSWERLPTQREKLYSANW